MKVVIALIQTLGFPVACVIGLAYFVVLIWKTQQKAYEKQITDMDTSSQKREDKLYAQIDKFSETLNNFNNTLIKIDTRVESIEKQLNRVDKCS